MDIQENNDPITYTLGELADKFNCEVVGDRLCVISGVSSLDKSVSGQITFLANSKYRSRLASTGASAVITSLALSSGCLTNLLLSDNPYAVYAQVFELFSPVRDVTPGVHDSAVIGEGCDVDESVAIAPMATIGERVILHEGVEIGPGSFIADDVEIGGFTRLAGNVSVASNTRIGNHCVIHPGVVLGADGFGFARSEGKWIKIPQPGGVIIGDDVEIGANTTIDSGTIEATMIENGVKLDNQIQIGHNVVIGEHSIIAACTAIAGSTRIGKRCSIGGCVGIVGHIDISDDVQITGMSFVSHNIRKKGVYSSGTPMQENSLWRRNYTRFKQLDSLVYKVREIEKKLNLTN